MSSARRVAVTGSEPTFAAIQVDDGSCAESGLSAYQLRPQRHRELCRLFTSLLRHLPSLFLLSLSLIVGNYSLLSN